MSTSWSDRLSLGREPLPLGLPETFLISNYPERDFSTSAGSKILLFDPEFSLISAFTHAMSIRPEAEKNQSVFESSELNLWELSWDIPMALRVLWMSSIWLSIFDKSSLSWFRPHMKESLIFVKLF